MGVIDYLMKPWISSGLVTSGFAAAYAKDSLTDPLKVIPAAMVGGLYVGYTIARRRAHGEYDIIANVERARLIIHSPEGNDTAVQAANPQSGRGGLDNLGAEAVPERYAEAYQLLMYAKRRSQRDPGGRKDFINEADGLLVELRTRAAESTLTKSAMRLYGDNVDEIQRMGEHALAYKTRKLRKDRKSKPARAGVLHEE